ncbi:AAA family ATPase [bacterium]|nr:AAA family ATPase [bacterium]
MDINNIERENFIKRFSPSILENTSGLELLKLLAYPKKNDDINLKEQFGNLHENKYDSLKNELENGLLEFGSGGAGYDTNFILAYRDGSWFNFHKKINLQQALELAESIKLELVKACQFLENNDFESFYNFTSSSQSKMFNKGYIHKYFHILYPHLISFYHARSWQNYYKQQLGLPQNNNYFDIEKYLLEKNPGCNIGKLSKELIEKYGTPKKTTTQATTKTDKGETNTMKHPQQPLNQILYGPPGTGKTYNTVVKAMEIINDEKYEKISNEKYKNLKKEFDNLKQTGQIEFVTFHQSYSYEEFVEGIKPDLNSEDKLTYELKDGIFKKICSDAQTTIKIEKNFDQIYDQLIKDLNSSKKLLILTTPNGSEFGIKTNKKNNLKIYTGENFDRNSVGVITKDYLQNEIFKNGRKCYVQGILDYLNEHYKLNMQTTKNTNKYILIIDEINRGNISKIFGELITLIEEDKRESLSLKLPYSQDPFTVPKNLYIIGTMNTSDRSIASIDIALRRRFTFKEMMPDSTLIDEELEVQGLNIQDIFKTLNERISVLLDRDHQIGHSYFMNLKADKDLETNFKQIWFDCIMPLLNEYFYGDWDKLQALLGKAQDNGESFIKKLSQVKFATSYTCDEDETFDFTPQKDIDFSKALKNAFETKKDEQEEK